MAEDTIWKGTSSQWKKFKSHALFILAICVAAYAQWAWVPSRPWLWPWIWVAAGAAGVWALWNWMLLRTTWYELTNERLITTHGILTKVTDTLELYRVRDMQVVQPLLLRMVGLQNVHLFTADATTEKVTLDYIPLSVQLGEELRKAVEACRVKKGVRALDVVNDTPGDVGGASPLV